MNSFQHFLIWIDVDNQINTVELCKNKNPILVGRSPDMDIEILNAGVSRKHAEITWQSDHIAITDLNSSFGTWVNNQKLYAYEPYILNMDAEIRLGNMRVWYEVRDSKNDTFQTKCIDYDENDELAVLPELENFYDKLTALPQFRSAPEASLSELKDMVNNLNAIQKERIREQHMLHKVTHLLNRNFDFNELSRVALDFIVQASNAERGLIFLLERDWRFRATASNGIDKNQQAILLDSHLPLFKEVLHQGHLQIVNDSATTSQKQDITAMCYAVIPLFQQQHFFGVIYLDHTSKKNRFAYHQRAYLTTFASHLSIALHNTHLFQKATTDDLTNLFTRGYIEEAITTEINRGLRTQEDLSILLLDLDCFKAINDTYGHGIGDEVLKHFARLLRQESRDYDSACRYGGEEFLLLLPKTDRQTAFMCAERIRLATEQLAIPYENKFVSFTTSIGIASSQFNNHDAQFKDYQSLIKAADKALYEAKREGRNRVKLAS